MSDGVTPAGSGYSAEPEPSSTVSAVPVSIPNAEAAARLTAAAPDLLEAAECLFETADDRIVGVSNVALQMLLAAVGKARGEAK